MRILKKQLWPHVIRIDSGSEHDKIDAIETWLGQTLGAFRNQWNVVYHYNGTDYYFKHDHDATLFALKWR